MFELRKATIQMKTETGSHIDPNIRRALEWFLGFLEPQEWNKRKEAIETHLQSILEPRRSREEALTSEPISIKDDRMGWYLYLAETSLYATYKYELIQGARVLPIFERLGRHFELLQRIHGIENKVRNLLYANRSQPDSGLFEILIALLWVRNGWPLVEFIPEEPPEKRPDIHAESEEQEWFIEAKRLASNSRYSQREREKWLSMWRHLRDFLIDYRLPYVLDIVFHVELGTLPESYLGDELAGKLRLISPPCEIVSNDIFDVSVAPVDFETARKHLRNNYVKYPSGQLNQLIAGRYDPSRGFTYVVGGRVIRIGEGRTNNQFLDTMDFAAGAVWHCDAEGSIAGKARDIRRHLAEALEQLPGSGPGVVHIGLETLDGRPVELERYRRIVNSVSSFDARGKDLRWVYCHLYQSYAPIDQPWVIDETVYYFSDEHVQNEEPLSHRFTLLPEGDASKSGFHWLLDSP